MAWELGFDIFFQGLKNKTSNIKSSLKLKVLDDSRGSQKVLEGSIGSQKVLEGYRGSQKVQECY